MVKLRSVLSWDKEAAASTFLGLLHQKIRVEGDVLFLVFGDQRGRLRGDLGQGLLDHEHIPETLVLKGSLVTLSNDYT